MRVQADSLVETSQECQVKIDGKWVIARPINYRVDTIWDRLRDAWSVLTGKAEALFYYKQ